MFVIPSIADKMFMITIQKYERIIYLNKGGVAKDFTVVKYNRHARKSQGCESPLETPKLTHEKCKLAVNIKPHKYRIGLSTIIL